MIIFSDGKGPGRRGMNGCPPPIGTTSRHLEPPPRPPPVASPAGTALAPHRRTAIHHHPELDPVGAGRGDRGEGPVVGAGGRSRPGAGPRGRPRGPGLARHQVRAALAAGRAVVVAGPDPAAVLAGAPTLIAGSLRGKGDSIDAPHASRERPPKTVRHSAAAPVMPAPGRPRRWARSCARSPSPPYLSSGPSPPPPCLVGRGSPRCRSTSSPSPTSASTLSTLRAGGASTSHRTCGQAMWGAAYGFFGIKGLSPPVETLSTLCEDGAFSVSPSACW